MRAPIWLGEAVVDVENTPLMKAAMGVTRSPSVALSAAWYATVVAAAAAAAKALVNGVVPLSVAANLLWLVFLSTQVKGGP